MNELIGRLAVKAGIGRSVAEKNIGTIADLVIPKFLRSDGRTELKSPGLWKFERSPVNFCVSVATNPERITWARSSRGRLGWAGSPE
jgi:hypothetical protein